MNAKRLWWLNKGRELEQDVVGNENKIYGLAKAYRKPTSQIMNIKDREGMVVTTPELINERWSEHFRQLLNVEQNEEAIGGGGRDLQDQPDEDGENEDITMDELNKAIQKMKNGKSPGCDGVMVELIKEGGQHLREEILLELNNVWRMGSIPEEWGKTIIIPVYKGKGEKSNCKNYRGISLINHIAKIYERILESRTREIVEDRLGE